MEKKSESELHPEYRIKQSAHDVFRRKGFNGARVSDYAGIYCRVNQCY